MEPIALQTGKVSKQHYAYQRNGSCALLAAIEPLTGKRMRQVFQKRTEKEYTLFLQQLAASYPEAKKIRLVQDNLNTHTIRAKGSSYAVSFHHFKPADAKRILQNAVDGEAPIALFEAQERDLQHLIKNMFSPLSVLLTTPFIRPFRLGRIIFTYLIPIVPLFVLWDGVISVLRTYTVEELKEMTKALENGDNYVWEIGKNQDGPVTIVYLLGYMKDA